MTKRNRKTRMETGPDSARQGGAYSTDFGHPRMQTPTVQELAEEGDTFEADGINGVENTRHSSVSEVVTHEIPEDDVRGETLDNDEYLA